MKIEVFVPDDDVRAFEKILGIFEKYAKLDNRQAEHEALLRRKDARIGKWDRIQKMYGFTRCKLRKKIKDQLSGNGFEGIEIRLLFGHHTLECKKNSLKYKLTIGCLSSSAAQSTLEITVVKSDFK